MAVTGVSDINRDNNTRIACAQLALDVERPASNIEVSLEYIEQAVKSGADIIVLPELASSGYMFASKEEAIEVAEKADGRSIKAWSGPLKGTSTIVVAGFCETGEGDALHNSVVLLNSDGAQHVYRKVHLWGDEKKVFEPGDKAPSIVNTQHGRVAVGICYDAYFPELARAVAIANAQLMVLPTNAPRNLPGEPPPPASFGDTPMQIKIWSSIAHVNGIFVAGCDRCGPERGVEWIGGSAIIDQNGVVLANHPEDYGPGLLLADCDLSQADSKVRGSRNDLLSDRRPDVYPSMGVGPEIEHVDL